MDHLCGMGDIMVKNYNGSKLCDYGCGQEAKYQFKNGKLCCCKSHNSCPQMKRQNRERQVGEKSSWFGRKHTEDSKEKIRQKNLGKTLSENTKRKIGNSNKGKTRTEEVKKKISEASKNISQETRNKMSNSQLGRKHTVETKRKISSSNKGKTKGKTWKELHGNNYDEIKDRHQQSITNYFDSLTEEQKKLKYGRRLIIEQINERYPFFSKIEEMRYNPDKPEEKEIQVRCKYYKCENSKEKDGWFTPIGYQFSDRVRSIETENGTDGSYFYCCQECKLKCPLYNLRPKEDINETQIVPLYTHSEYQTFRQHVLERDEYKCQYCGEQAEHVHHERPQKLEPFFALDPDLAWSVCQKCHYEKAHKGECNTGNLANKKCKQ
jgi:hypothetical protein